MYKVPWWWSIWIKTCRQTYKVPYKIKSVHLLVMRVIIKINWKKKSWFQCILAPFSLTAGWDTRNPQLRNLGGAKRETPTKSEQFERIDRLAEASCRWLWNDSTQSITLFVFARNFRPSRTGNRSQRKSLQIYLFHIFDYSASGLFRMNDILCDIFFSLLTMCFLDTFYKTIITLHIFSDFVPSVYILHVSVASDHPDGEYFIILKETRKFMNTLLYVNCSNHTRIPFLIII
jgi:hypothetical protein